MRPLLLRPGRPRMLRLLLPVDLLVGLPVHTGRSLHDRLGLPEQRGNAVKNAITFFNNFALT